MHLDDVADPAFLVMDFQQAMCADDGCIGSTGFAGEIRRRRVLNRLSGALTVMRRSAVPIILIRLAFGQVTKR